MCEQQLLSYHPMSIVNFDAKRLNFKKKQHIDILAGRPRKIDILFWKPFKIKLKTVILHCLLIVLLVGIDVLPIVQTFCRAHGT